MSEHIYGTDEHEGHCSECGAEVVKPARYCPNCGRMVVE